MDEKRIVESRKFLAVVTSPVIANVIDLKKLSKSPNFSMAVEMATQHAQHYGNFGYLNKIMCLLDGSTYAVEFLNSLRPNLNFVLTDTKPRKLMKASHEEAVQQAAKQILVKAKPAEKKPAIGKSQDILDSRLMLSGSYGNGKRR